MKILLVNDTGQLVASVESLERYDVRDSGHVFALLDLLEALLATAKGPPASGASAPVVSEKDDGLVGNRKGGDLQ